MDLSRSSCREQEDDSAIMLFGKQIKGISSKGGAEIKEQLSPRGVDERGTLSFATSSDEEEELNLSAEQTCEDVIMEASDQKAQKQWEKQKSNEEGDCPAARREPEKQQSKEGESPTVRMGGGKLKGGVWSRCPRCHSVDTKFCYFNNYNVNQPRHFCKHCQRYWTAGGTLRNVPVGAGKRKNKYTLHKQAFLAANSICAPDVAIQDAPLGLRDRVPTVKSEYLDTVTIVKSDLDPVPIVKSDAAGVVPIMKSGAVNTNLELSASHTFTDSPRPPSALPPCIQSHPSPLSSISMPSHTPHNLITLHQRHLDLQSRSSQLCPNLASGSSKSSQIFPDFACGSGFNPICPDLACEKSGVSPVYPEQPKLSQFCPSPNLACLSSGLSQVCPSESPGLNQIRAQLQSRSLELSQLCPPLHSGSSGLRQISPSLQSGSSELAKQGPDLQSGSSTFGQACTPHRESGSSRSGQTCPHWESGSCESSPVCLKNEISGLAKSDQNLESGLPDLAKITPSSNHGLNVLKSGSADWAKITSSCNHGSSALESGIPDLAKISPSFNHGLSVLESGLSELGKNTPSSNHGLSVDLPNKGRYLQLGCTGSRESKAEMKGEGSGHMDMKAPTMCDANFSSCDTPSMAHVLKSEEAFNGQRAESQVPPLYEGSLPIWAGLWPYFYNMYLMDGVAPLAFPHLRPILTPQGWALPFLPPSATNVDPTTFNSPFPPPPLFTRTPPTSKLESFDSTHEEISLLPNTTSSIPATSSTPTTPILGTPNSYAAYIPPSHLLSTSKDISNGAFNVPTTSLGKRSAQHASFEDHEGFGRSSSKSSKG
eukprot:c21294_g1_i1 orf=407-2875(-)